jgi:hypothetical protein
VTTQPMLPFTTARIQQRRDSSRARVEAFFGDNIGIKFSTKFLHHRFGSAFRTRKSEINRDPFSSIHIKKECDVTKQGDERFRYWAILK